MPSDEQILASIEIEPANTAKHTIICLHGLGADGGDLVPIVSELNLPASLDIRFIFPHAPTMPITINNGYEMRAWYDIAGLSINSTVDKIGIANSAMMVHKLVDRQIEQGISTDKIILAGFSQGALIALVTGLCYTQPLGGIIALSGYLPHAAEVLTKASAVNRQIPIFMGHGTEDMIVPYASGKAAYSALKEADYPVEWHSYPVQHSVAQQEIVDISNWVQKVWR